jgi:hypothetical protein
MMLEKFSAQLARLRRQLDVERKRVKRFLTTKKTVRKPRRRRSRS